MVGIVIASNAYLVVVLEGGGSPDEARLEQTHTHSNPTNLALFRHKIHVTLIINTDHVTLINQSYKSTFTFFACIVLCFVMCIAKLGTSWYWVRDGLGTSWY